MTHILERLRLAEDLSRERLAAASGTSARGILEIEKHGRRPHRRTAEALAAALGVDWRVIRPPLTDDTPGVQAGRGEEAGSGRPDSTD